MAKPILVRVLWDEAYYLCIPLNEPHIKAYGTGKTKAEALNSFKEDIEWRSEPLESGKKYGQRMLDEVARLKGNPEIIIERPRDTK